MVFEFYYMFLRYLCMMIFRCEFFRTYLCMFGAIEDVASKLLRIIDTFKEEFSMLMSSTILDQK